MICYLNPGHDRQLDSGAVNRHCGIRECDLAWELGEAVKGLLEVQGLTVHMRQSDDLFTVCDEANAIDADIFVSLHFNAFNCRASGTETLISSSPSSLILGHCIQSHLVRTLELPNRGLKERAGLYVLRNTAMPAVLVEICFVDNDCDLARYQVRQEKVAQAIADGIITYKCEKERQAVG